MNLFTGTSEISNPKHSMLQRLLCLFFLALFCFPLFPLFITNYVLIAFSALSIAVFIVKPFSPFRLLLKNLVFVLPFLPYLAEYLMSGFDPLVRFELGKKMFFLTAPFTIPLFIKATGFRNYKLPLQVFSFSVLALSLYTLSALLIKGIPFLADSYENGSFILRQHVQELSGLHPTYFSLFALSAAVILSYASTGLKLKYKILMLSGAVLCASIMILMAARIAYLSLVLFIPLWLAGSKFTKTKKLMIGFGALALLLVFLLSIPSLRARFGELASWSAGQSNSSNTISQRSVIFDCSIQVFSKHLLLGTGCRNFQHKLNQCYQTAGMATETERNYNPHNQFLSLGINYGLFLLLLFVACLVIILRKVVRFPEGRYYALALLLFFLSESLLERQMGIYFFGLISLMFYNVEIIRDDKKEVFHSDSINPLE